MRVLFVVLMANHVVILIDHLALLFTCGYIDILVLYYVLLAMPMFVLTVLGEGLFIYKRLWRYAIVHGVMVILLLVVCSVANNSIQ